MTTEIKQENYFSQLAKIDCSEHVEKKGKFSYLSWAWAVKKLREVDPTATWEVIRFDGVPFMKTECGYFVEVAVTMQGVTLSQIHPILNNQNRPIEKPNSFDINTSIQRCLVKAIALHGLGLYIYAGEDLPEIEEEYITAQQLGEFKVLAGKFAQMRDKTPDEVIKALGIKDVTRITTSELQAYEKKINVWIQAAKKADEEAKTDQSA